MMRHIINVHKIAKEAASQIYSDAGTCGSAMVQVNRTDPDVKLTKIYVILTSADDLVT